MRSRGFTLVELMVSIALFGLIASGAMMLVMSGVRMQSHSVRVDVAQSALRAGLDFLSRDLLSASAGMMSGNIRINGTDNLTIQYANNSGLGGQDSIELYLADSNYDYSTVYAGVSQPASTITVDKTAQFTPPQAAILTDFVNGVQINITGTAAGSLTVTGIGSGAFANNVNSYAQSNAYVFALRHVKYSVAQCFGAANTKYANQSCLMMDLFDGNGPQPLAEGVEDLQIALGFDNDGDGLITEGPSTTDEWIGNVAGDATITSLTNLKAVRITIIATSTMNENVTVGAQQFRPAAEDHPASTTLDGFFRRVIRSEVSVRNFNI